MNFQLILDDIHSEVSKLKNIGKVASYIPELSSVSKNKFGIHLQLKNGDSFSVGNSDELFSIQSISKVLSLSKAFSIVGDKIWGRIDVEPSGNPFNYLTLLEHENGIPRNPLINSGALVIADILVSNLENPKEEFLQYIRKISGDESIEYNKLVAESERKTGYKNFAAAHLLKSFNNLENEIDVVLDFYFYQCSIEMNCKQLAETFCLFIDQDKKSNDILNLTCSQIKRINALMLTCGFYDEAGEFAFEVGLPGKSGVGGGIVAILPNEYSIATWSPALNIKGNSYLGMETLKRFTTDTKLSIF